MSFLTQKMKTFPWRIRLDICLKFFVSLDEFHWLTNYHESPHWGLNWISSNYGSPACGNNVWGIMEWVSQIYDFYMCFNGVQGFTLGRKLQKYDYIKKCFKQKLFRIKFSTKNSLDAFLHQPQEWNYRAPKIVIF